MEEKVTSHIIKGLVLGIISVFISVVVHTFNLYENPYVSLVTYGVFMIGIIYSTILFANQNDNNVTFGNIFAHGFKTTAVVIVITVIYTLLALYVLFPDMVDKIIEMSRVEMAKNPKLTDEMIEQGIAMTKKLFLPFAIAGAIFGTGFLGAIGSLIGAAVAKKNPVDPFKQDTAQ